MKHLLANRLLINTYCGGLDSIHLLVPLLACVRVRDANNDNNNNNNNNDNNDNNNNNDDDTITTTTTPTKIPTTATGVLLVGPR